MNYREFLYHLLYEAFILLREEGHETKNKKVFWISNLLHNLPFELKNIEKPEEFEKVFSMLEDVAQHDGMKRWFDSMIASYIETEEMKKTAAKGDSPSSQ